MLCQSLAVMCHASTDAAEAVAARHAAVRVLRPDLSGLSPWRLVNREGLVEEHLATARRDLAFALDPLGRVVPGATPRPRAAVIGATPKLGLLVRARSWRRTAA